MFDAEIVSNDAVFDGRKLDVVSFLLGCYTWNRPKAGFTFPEVGRLG